MRWRTFTIEEADRTIPLVRRIASDVVDAYTSLSELAGEYKELRSGAAGDPAARATLDALKGRMAELSEEIDAFVEELAEIGCEMKDLSLGLVDFPSELDGRPILLCWRPGEPRVEYWHETNEGYRDRKPLPVTVPEE